MGIMAAMLPRWLALLGFLIVLPCLWATETRRFTAKVAPTVVAFRFAVHINGSEKPEENDARRVDWIEVRSGRRLVQTIRFADDDEAPIDFGDPKELVSLVDVDCDGYKDLLVRKSVEMWGATEDFLYLYDPNSRSFVAYPAFTQLQFWGVSCPAKLVNTYDREGWAG
jgi:hypothetical protein